MKNNIQTDLGEIYTRFIVDESVTDWLKESSEIIFDIAQKAVQENRFEIVDSALNNICELTKEYVKARLKYTTEQDAYIDYIHSRLIDSKNLVNKDTHPKIMLSIVRVTKDIALSTLQLKPIRNFAGENFIPLGFIDLLSNICLSQEILKDTSYAPMSTIDFLVEIAKKAIDNDFPRTATLVTDKLGSIAVTTTKLHFFYGDTISAKANWGLATILDYMFYKQEVTKFHIEYELESVLEQINKSITTYIEDDIKYPYSIRSNIKTFFGPLAEHGIATIFINALNTKSDKHLPTVLGVLETFLQNINQNIMKGMDNSKYLDIKDILENIYVIGLVFVNFAKDKKESNIQSEMISLLKESFLLPFANAISMSFKKDINRYTIFDDDYLKAFFSLMGIIFYENNKNLFDDVLEEWIGEVINIIQKYKTQTTIEHEKHIFKKHEITNLLSDLYKYLRLTGVWFNNYLPKSHVLKTIITELKSQPDITISQDMYGRRILYPKDLIDQRLIVMRPFLPYDPKYFSNLDSALQNQDIIDKFEKKLINRKTKSRAKKEKK